MATNNSIDKAVITTIYNASDTWSKNARTQWVKVYLFGAGQGGASGRQGTSASSGGGTGGGSGAAVIFEGPGACFANSQTVTVPGTTTGATGQVTAATNGNGLAALTSFAAFGNLSTLSVAVGASIGGTTGTTTGGVSGNGYDFGAGGTPYPVGSAGNGTATNGGASGGSNRATSLTGTSGGGGAGANSVTERTGGAGGAKLMLDGSGVIAASAAGGVESGTINGTNGATGSTGAGLLGVFGGGLGGGGGGGQSVGLVAGNGGNGGFPGGGGGGGGASITGTTSGAGGNGAAGQVIVVEFLS